MAIGHDYLFRMISVTTTTLWMACTYVHGHMSGLVQFVKSTSAAYTLAGLHIMYQAGTDATNPSLDSAPSSTYLVVKSALHVELLLG